MCLEVRRTAAGNSFPFVQLYGGFYGIFKHLGCLVWWRCRRGAPAPACRGRAGQCRCLHSWVAALQTTDYTPHHRHSLHNLSTNITSAIISINMLYPCFTSLTTSQFNYSYTEISKALHSLNNILISQKLFMLDNTSYIIFKKFKSSIEIMLSQKLNLIQ